MKKQLIEKFIFSINQNQNDAIKNGVVGREVAIPHTWNIEDETLEYAGIGWYSTKLNINNIAYKTVIFFHAVYRDCNVYINGEWVMTHAGSGYTPFEIDITGHLKMGENLLVVKCDNSYSKDALPHMKDFDWANDGGIIRNVELIEYEKNDVKNISIKSEVLDFLDNDKCNAKITYRVEMISSEIIHYTIRIKEKQSDNVIFEKHMTACEYDCILNNIDLWNVNNPNLYVLEMDFGDTFAKRQFGVRKIETNGDKIILNNRELRLIAVEWMPGSNPDYGMAEPESELIKNLEMLKDLNCNFTRFHWQQDEFVLNWCDEHGLLVQEEIPYWGFPKKVGEKQIEIAKMQADEMLCYHFNHPSIVCWGVGNELGGWHKKTKEYVKDMVKYFKASDSSRLVNFVSNTLWIKSKIRKIFKRKEATYYGDICMWNDYLGTWFSTANVEKCFKNTIQLAKGKPLVITEFGICEPKFSGGDTRRIAIYEEKLALYREHNLAGWVYFCLNDYRTHVGESGSGKFKQRIHGSVDLAGNKKPSYEFIKNENLKDI